MQSIQVRPSTTGFPRSATPNDPETGSWNDSRVAEMRSEMEMEKGEKGSVLDIDT
jgi:hypothetical protein